MSHQQVTNEHGIHKMDREEVPSRQEKINHGKKETVEKLCFVARKVRLK